MKTYTKSLALLLIIGVYILLAGCSADAEIQSIELMINGYESDVNYSAVSITIRAAKTFFERIKPVPTVFPFIAVYVAIPLIVIKIVNVRKKEKTGCKLIWI